MARKDYLFKRANSQFWQVRWMVPKAIRKRVGRSEFTKSLGVTDKEVAKRLARAQLQLWEQEIGDRFVAAARPSVLREATDLELEAYATETYFEQQREYRRKFIQLMAKDGSQSLSDQRAEQASTLDRMNERLFLSEGEGGIGVAKVGLAEMGLAIPDDEGRRTKFAKLLQNALADAVGSVLADIDRKEFTPSSTILEARKNASKKAKAGEGILDLFDRYGAQRLAEKRKRQDTIDQDRKIVEQFAEFIGKDRSVGSIIATEVREWRDTVADLPPSFRKHKVNEGLTMREAAAKAKKLGKKGVSPTTINKYLSTVSPFLKWCRANSYIDHDPCNGLFYDLQKLKRRRPPFSTDQLNKILTSPLFTGFLRDGKESLPGNSRATDWRYWIPLVCMFTGARIGEIAQLGVDDLREQDGIPYLLIKHDEESGQTTKSGYERPAAMHPMLKVIGFLDYVDGQKKRASKDGNKQLFPDLKPNERGQAGTVSRFWRTYLERIGLKNGADGFGSHSFRHTMADQLRLAGYLDDAIEVALGHNQVSVTAGYGQVRQGTAALLDKMMKDVRFEGVNFDHLLNADTTVQPAATI